MKMSFQSKFKYKVLFLNLYYLTSVFTFFFLKNLILKLGIELPYNPAIPLLGIHTEETRTERDTYTPVFIAALFTIARTWKQPRHPLANKWIRKLWYIYTMEYDSSIKRNAFESVLMRWMKLEPIIQNALSERKTPIQYINTYIWKLERWLMMTLYVR